MQKFLPGPFAWDNLQYASISLLTDYENFDEAGLIRNLESYSCYPPTIPKILQCLKSSGRYDCTVMMGWVRGTPGMAQAVFRNSNVILYVRNIFNLNMDTRAHDVCHPSEFMSFVKSGISHKFPKRDAENWASYMKSEKDSSNS